MGGTKWNKGGTSERTYMSIYGPVGWDLYSIEMLPSVGSRVELPPNIFLCRNLHNICTKYPMSA